MAAAVLEIRHSVTEGSRRPPDRRPPPRSPARRTRPRRLRSRPGCADSWLFPQHVAEPAYGLDQPRIAHLPPQIADVDPQPVRLRAKVVPHTDSNSWVRESTRPGLRRN